MTSAINWFEIPVSDMNRARAFYSTILGSDLTDPPSPMDTKGIDMAFFPNQEGVGGALCHSEEFGYKPSQTGSVIYLNGGADLNDSLSRVEDAGGQVLVEKMSIGENGFIAFFIDTEGNKIGLHSSG